MKTEKINVYNHTVKNGVANEYPTPDYSFRQPQLMMLCGQRTSGKSYLTSKMLAQAKKDETFDIVYIITPSFASNASYWKHYIRPENSFDPTSDSIQRVIAKVEADRDEWESFLEKKTLYEKTSQVGVSYIRRKEADIGSVSEKLEEMERRG